jgi:hypothetical protein
MEVLDVFAWTPPAIVMRIDLCRGNDRPTGHGGSTVSLRNCALFATMAPD